MDVGFKTECKLVGNCEEVKADYMIEGAIVAKPGPN